MQKLDSKTFDDLLRRASVFANGDAQSVFDLNGVELITPAALVQLAAASHALAAQGKTAIIEIDDDNVRSYLVRAGFITAIEGAAQIKPYLAANGLLWSSCPQGNKSPFDRGYQANRCVQITGIT